MPRQPGSDLLQVHVATIDQHRADGPPIAVGLMIFKLGHLSVCLGFLGRINSREPDSVLHSIGSEDGDRVPIGHPYDATDELVAR